MASDENPEAFEEFDIEILVASKNVLPVPLPTMVAACDTDALDGTLTVLPSVVWLNVMYAAVVPVRP